jgi:hypothetical protein
VVRNFNPADGTYTTYVKDEENTLAGFKLRVKNDAGARAGNQIAASTSDNFAIDVYFAQADLSTSPSAVKTSAFPASLTSGDLTVGLAPGAKTPLQVLTASGITLPTLNCNQYTWICAGVKGGSGAQYIDSDTMNNCKCSDASAKISCPSGRRIAYQVLANHAAWHLQAATCALTDSVCCRLQSLPNCPANPELEIIYPCTAKILPRL